MVVLPLRPVPIRFFLVWIFLFLALEPAMGQDFQEAHRTGLVRQIQSNWFQYNVIGGRLVATSLRMGSFSRSISVNGRKETLAVRMHPEGGMIRYDAQLSQGQILFDISGRDRFHLRYVPEDGAHETVDFLQEPGHPLVLSLGTDSTKRIFQAESLWLLWFTEREKCTRHLLPFLNLLREDWQILETIEEVEAELLRMASSEASYDETHWARLVEQLADRRFAVREAADRQLREAGQPVVLFLEGLDPGRLDAEQRFRIHRILEALSSGSGDDSVRRVASRLAVEPTVWLTLLGREEEATRRLACERLGGLLGESIDFDPAAEEAVRAKQIEKIRQRLASG